MPTIERDGAEIYYEDVGTGRTLVLLHGFLFSTEMWAQQVRDLRGQYRIITVDFRGHGRSSKARKGFTLYDLVSDVVAVMDECDVHRAVWIGLSMGGMVAMRAAITVPEAVEALVLLDTSAAREPAMNRFRYRSMAFGSRFVGLRPFVSTVAEMMFGPTTRRERPELVKRWTKHLAKLDARSVRCALESIVRRDSVSPILHEIDVPTLVLVGQEDEATPPHLSRQIAEGIIGARLDVISGAGHMSSLERPRRVGERIEEFLRSSEEVEPASPDYSAARQQSTDASVSDEEPSGETERADDRAVTDEAPEPSDSEEIEVEGITYEEPEPGKDEPSGADVFGLGDGDESVPDELSDLAHSVPGAEEIASGKEPGDELALPGGKKGTERRGKRRVAPSRKLYGRVGHVGILLVDVSESGARVEHYNRRFQTGSSITLEIEWESQTMKAECQVVSSRVHRFIPGEKGATVYQSGLLFRHVDAESEEVLKELVGRLVTRGLAEQVANARGIGPVLQNDMPTFRSGVVSAGGRPKEAGSEGPARLIRESPITDQIGFIRCRKKGIRWEKKWTLDSSQPEQGFTILASENKLEIDMLCETWDHGDEEARKFIQDCARMSIDAALAERERQ